MSKEKFKSKRAFILASCGAAVGLGNALRFPGLCAKYGGAYLIVYFIALVTLGIPLLNAEIALGRRVGSGAPECLDSLKRGGGRAGWASCANSVLTAVLYAGLAGWILAEAFNIFPLSLNAANMQRTEIASHFFGEVINSRGDGVISGISPLVLLCIIACWGLMYLCLKGGAKSLAKAAEFTVIIPVIMLVIMAGRGLLYANSAQALKKLFTPDFSALALPDFWLSALGQVFFSLSVGVGIMPAYGAYLPKNTNIYSCSLVIAFADFSVSLISSVALYTTLYGCGLEGEIGASGIITAFAVYPVAITRLFGGNAVINGIAGVLFYGSLTMLAVQSAVSMAEAFISPFCSGFNIKKKKAVAVFCAAGGVISMIFATTAAPLIVEISDKFVNFYNVLLLGIIECSLIGTRAKEGWLVDEINKYSKKLKMREGHFVCAVKYLSPVILSAVTLSEFLRLMIFGTGYEAWAQISFGWGLSLAVALTAFVIYYFSYGTRDIRVKKLSKKGG